MVNSINNNMPRLPAPEISNNTGVLVGRSVEQQHGETKSTNAFKKAMSALGSFLASSAKFIAKTVLFVTGVTPLIWITKLVINALSSKKESQPLEANPQAVCVAAPRSVSPAVSEEDMDGLCEALSGFHASNEEDAPASNATVSEMHESIQAAMDEIVHPAPAAQSEANVRRRSTREKRPPNRYGFE